MHRRPTPLITTWLILAAAIWLLYAFGNWSPAYRGLLPPVYAILAFVGVGYTLRWAWPRSHEDRRHDERRHDKRRHEGESER